MSQVNTPHVHGCSCHTDENGDRTCTAAVLHLGPDSTDIPLPHFPELESLELTFEGDGKLVGEIVCPSLKDLYFTQTEKCSPTVFIQNVKYFLDRKTDMKIHFQMKNLPVDLISVVVELAMSYPNTDFCCMYSNECRIVWGTSEEAVMKRVDELTGKGAEKE